MNHSAKKLDYVDALRGLAILGVIMVHANQYGNSNVPKIFAKVFAEGARGVQLFYVASAFTLFLSFKNRMLKEKSPTRNFFIRRFFRIAPMYYIGICYYLFQDGFGPRLWLGNETHISTMNILSNFTFLHAFNPYWITSLVPGGWSIGVEMCFYGILPFLFSKIKNINQAFNFFVISLLLKYLLQVFFIKYNLISDPWLWTMYLSLYFPSQLPIFCLGILMYFMIIEEQDFKNISGKSLFLFSVLLLIQLASEVEFMFTKNILFGFGFLLLGLALNTYRFKLLVNPIVIYIGKISFSMYLVHFAVLHCLTNFNCIDFFENGLLNYFTKYFLVCALTIAVSSLFYKLIEVPFQNMGKKIIDRFENKN